MAEKLILHIGFHKTGTTAIQASLFAAQARLADYGIVYPARASHGAAWSLNAKVWGWANRGGRLTPQSKWKKFVRKANAAKGTFLASSEFFAEIDEQKISKIKTEIKATDYRVIFTIRPLAKMLASSYQQYLKYGLKANYEHWLHEMLDEPGSSKMTPSFWRRNFHGQEILKWAKAFGPENVTVIVVDETQPDFMYQAFADYLRLPDGLLTKQETGGNRSLTAEEATMLQQLNKQFPKNRLWDDYSIFIRQTAIRALTDKPAPESGTKLLTPQWAITAAESHTQKSIDQISAAGVAVIGNLDSLKNAKIPVGNAEAANLIPIETMVEALLAFEQGVIRKMRWRVLLVEIVRRLKKRAFGITTKEEIVAD